MQQSENRTPSYAGRADKAEEVWRIYRQYLEGKKVLDVGADECYLKKYVTERGSYLGIGKGGNPDREVDLDAGALPFADGEFETVICMDVLEHLEHIHFVFDELCRVSSESVIISLPNCLGHLWRVLTRLGAESAEGLTRYYGLPLEPPADRHRWFFDALEAERFIRHRAEKNGMRVVAIKAADMADRPRLRKRFLVSLAYKLILRDDIDRWRLNAGTVWAVLAKADNA